MNDYKKPLTLSETHKLLFDILVSIDRCCRDNNIKYSLGFGTLLGAVRHHGFIPWDDDIDLLMTREELNKFIKCYSSTRYEMIANDRPDWGWSYISISDTKTIVKYDQNYERVTPHGIWVSIFPIDNRPDDETEWKKQQKSIVKYFNLCRLKRSKWVPTGIVRNIAKLFARAILAPFSLRYFAKKQEDEMSRYNNVNTNNCYRMVQDFCSFPSYIMLEHIDLEFEGYMFMALKEYDTYLKIEYGDYLTLPPIDQRIPKHNYNVYYI